MRAALLALTGAIALGGCASDKLTLFENEDGNATGAVAILDPVTLKERVEVNTALTEAKLTSRPKPRAVKQVKPAYTELLANLPLKAERITILFEFKDNEIPAAQRGKIDDIRKAIELRPGAQIEVVGYTDTMGPAEGNLTLSEDRAKSVITELVALGIPIDIKDAVGRGELEAVASGDPDSYANPLYRKVVVVVR